MNEGSRNEKAGIVIASYVIGFVTAFILFTSVNNISPIETYITLPETNSASVVGATNAPVADTLEVPVVTEMAAEEAVPVMDDSFVTYSKGLLEAHRADGVRLLSFNPKSGSINVDLSTLEQGYHYDEVAFAVSAEEDYVFFCEKHAVDSETCSGYVYDVKADKIAQVSKNGSAVPITLKSASETIWTALGLKIGTHYSENLTTPWIIVAR